MEDGSGRDGSHLLVIIGATRSGTNILRDVLTALPGFTTWPCDEINAIWRFGNVAYPSDELPVERATGRVVRYVRGRFERRRRLGGGGLLVEKTCANSLRVPFVDRIFPQARYLFIHRDPLDAVASATLRWRAPFDLAYTLRKARFVPLRDAPHYALELLRNRLFKLRAGGRRLRSWGPRPTEMDLWLREDSLEVVCARVWAACIERSVAAFARLPRHRFLELRYEDLAGSPRAQLERILRFLELESSSEEVARAAAPVGASSVGRGRASLAPSVAEEIRRVVVPAQRSLEAFARGL